MKRTITILGFLLLTTNLLIGQWEQTSGPFGGVTGSILVNGSNIFIGTYNGIYHSSNNGNNWTRLSGFPEGHGKILAFNGGRLYASNLAPNSPWGLYISVDNGQSWTQASGPVGYTRAIVFKGDTCYAADIGEVVVSYDNGYNWSYLPNNGLPTNNTEDILIKGDSLYVGTNCGGIFLSTDFGTNWTSMNNGLSGLGLCIYKLHRKGNYMFTATASGVFRSLDNGNTWLPTPITSLSTDLSSNTTYIFAAASYGYKRSSNNGASWVNINLPINNLPCISIQASGSNVYAGTYGGFYRSSNNGSSWSVTNEGLNTSWCRSMTENDSYFFTGTYGGLFKTLDAGENWIKINTGLPTIGATAIASNNSTLFASFPGYGVYISQNNGESWSPMNNGLTSSTNCLEANGIYTYAGTSNGVFRSSNNSNTWVQINTGLSDLGIRNIAVSGSKLLVATNSGVFVSFNNGDSWTLSNNGLTNTNINAVAIINTTTFAATNGGGIFRSSNNGANWISVSNGFPGNNALELATKGSIIFAKGIDIFYSSNLGSTWTLLDTGYENMGGLSSTIFVNDSIIYSGTDNKGVVRSILPCFPIVITQQTPSQTRSVCSKATFSVTPGGTPPYEYSWHKNGILIAGASDSVYVTPNCSLNDNNSVYYCIVSNCSGQVDTSQAVTLTVVPPCKFDSPSVLLSSSTLSPNENLVITGSNFTPYGEVVLTIKGENGVEVGTGIDLSYPVLGGFEFVLPITPAFLHGQYTIDAYDASTGTNAPTTIFHVNNFNEPGIHIISPSLGSVYGQGTLFDVVWTDFVGSNVTNGQGGLISKTYKIEISLNGGQTWSIIWTDNHTEYAPSNEIHTFIFQNYSTYSSGTFILRITDLDDPTDVALSEPFTVYSCSTVGFQASLEWDATVPDYIRNIKPNPIGLAADSTARIFIKLKKSSSNDKLVSEIHGTITSSEYSTPALVGKIKYATNHLLYSTEGNNANLTSEIYNASTNANADNYWFWLVAPDDFTNNLDDERTYRELDVQFVITYLDNTSETIILCNPIYIYRPALALAHGLNGDVSTFQYCRYTNNTGGESVFDPSFLWKVSKRFDLEEFGSFQTNAELLLNVGADEDNPFENSILKLIEKMHIMGIANKRIDYVAHSMGGVAGRTAISYGGSWYSPGLHFKNYGNGYINKFITVCTPHNGSYLADWAVDIMPFLPIIPGAGLAITSAALFDNIGFITKSGNIAPAVFNMQSNEQGVPFTTTTVKNHLISADIDQFDILDEDLIIQSQGSLGLNKLRWLTSIIYGSFNNYFLSKYGTSEFFSESDFVVQLSSQLATKPENEAININDNPLGIGKTSIIYGIDKFHMGIVEDIKIGNRIKTLLNAQMNSGLFAKTISAKPVIQNNLTSELEFLSRMPAVDSVLNHIDTTKIEILTPQANQYFQVDSINEVVVRLKDTMNLQSIFLYVQDQYFTSDSRDSLQAFSSAVGPNILGRNLIIAIAQYDSMGIIVNHIDTVSFIVGSIDSLLSLDVNPRTINLNPTEEFQPDIQLIYSNYIARLNPENDSLFHAIVDTNVIQYDSIGTRFIAKDTGSTYIVFSYGESFDTTFVYISQPLNSSIINLCSLDTISLFAGTSDSTKVYQWQVDSLDGFVDIYDNPHYINTNDSVLTIANPPSYWYNYRYRCIISDLIGSKVGNIYTIRFKSTWNGAIDSLWHTAGNWSCDSIPNSHIDVLIPSNAPRYPHIDENAYCRTLRLEDAAEVIVVSPNLLCVSGDDRLLCPEDIVIKLCGQNEVIVEYDISLSSMCSGTIVQTSGFASGNTFPVGTTTNCFEYIDELGVIVSTCCFDVIILEDTPPTIVCSDFSVPCSEPFLPEDLVGTDTSILSVSISPNLPIGPGAGVVTEATIELTPPSGAIIYDINVLVDLDHSWSADLDVYLIAPDGTSVELATDVCSSSDNWADVTFDDEASIPVNSACGGNPALHGPVKPEGHLYDLDSMPVAGTWTLMITDDTGGDAGILNTFGIAIEYTLTIPAYPIVADDCEISSLTYTDNETAGICPGYMAVNRLWTIVDNNGNFNTCNQTITFLPASLESVTCPPTYVGSCNSYNSPGTTGYPIYNGVQIDEGGLCNLFASYSDQDTILEGYFTVLRTWRIVDTCTSLDIECVQSIISYDNESPIITCPDSIETSCLENIGPAVTGYPSVEDDCSVSLTYADSVVTGDCILVFSTISRTWTATDDSGNSSSCEQIITLLTDDPQIICPGNIIIALAPGQNYTQVDYSISTLCNCTDSIVQTSGIESGGLFPIGTTTNCFKLVDSNGLVIDSCCFDVFVYIHCLEGGITFSTQSQVDSFSINFPGCTTIDGNVIIDDGGSGNITSLLGLGQLTIITGDLIIQNNSDLVNCSGLDSLLNIGNSLYIQSNSALINLVGLGSVTSIGLDLFIQYNNALINLIGLGNLGSIAEDFFIQSNQVLASLDGLPSLASIGTFFVVSNPSLTSLAGIGTDTSLDIILIENNSSLTNLSGLDQVSSIDRFLYVGGNASLTDFNGLESLTSIGEQLYIYYNPVLTSLTGLESLNSVGGFYGLSLTIDNNVSLTSLAGLSGVTSIAGALEITNNSVLTSLTGLDNINSNTITNLIIQGSGMLSICDIQCICDYLDIQINPASISGNAAGCATRMEVEDECGN